MPNRSYTPAQIEQPLFAVDSLPLLVQIKPQATLRQLQVSFPLPDYRELYDVKPLAYVGNLVGHEGEGSLLSRLKSEGLAESVAAGSGLGWRGGSLFSVTINLTEKGVADHERVLQMLFAYTEMLRENGPQSWLYEEQAQLAELSFRFKEKSEPIRYVSALASGMHYYDPQDALRGPYMMTRYDEQLLADLFQRLTPENAIVVFSDAGVATDTVSQRYDVPYSADSLTAEQNANWEAADAGKGLRLFCDNTLSACELYSCQQRATAVELLTGVYDGHSCPSIRASGQAGVPVLQGSSRRPGDGGRFPSVTASTYEPALDQQRPSKPR